MSILNNFLPYLGQVLLVAVLATLLLVRLVKDKKLRMGGVAVLLLMGLFVPVYGLTFSQWLRSVVGDLSVLTLLIFANILAQRLFNHSLLKSATRNKMLLVVALAGLAFYPLALGVSAFDPYRLGYTPLLMSAALCIVSIYAWFSAKRELAVILILPIIAFNLHLLESANLWDYLLDPILFVYAVVQWLVSSLFPRLKKMGAQYGKIATGYRS